jgi:hypothetical protein
LVRIRNELVHGFVQSHDIWTQDGLTVAIDHLRAVYEIIDARFLEMREWVQSVRASAQHALDAITGNADWQVSGEEHS